LPSCTIVLFGVSTLDTDADETAGDDTIEGVGMETAVAGAGVGVETILVIPGVINPPDLPEVEPSLPAIEACPGDIFGFPPRLANMAANIAFR
jgi:hypothetical protein